MHLRLLKAADGPSASELVRTAFQQADGEQEARTVSELVERFFERFPRADLFGYGAYEEATIIGCLFFSR
jgi:hypothetical protein